MTGAYPGDAKQTNDLDKIVEEVLDAMVDKIPTLPIRELLEVYRKLQKKLGDMSIVPV